MTTKAEKKELLGEYLPLFQPLTHEAKVAYGSRATESHAHDVSRAYTALLVEYTSKDGSLLMLAEALGSSYPALRRRVMTANITPLVRRRKSKATARDYASAVKQLTKARARGSAVYHSAIKDVYDRGISLNHLAKEMGLKSAYPLYYGLNKVRLSIQKQEQEQEAGE